MTEQRMIEHRLRVLDEKIADAARERDEARQRWARSANAETYRAEELAQQRLDTLLERRYTQQTTASV